MKLKSLLFVCLLGLISSVFAANRHVPVYNEHAKPAANAKIVKTPGPCQIEIINRSDYPLKVDGEVLDSYGYVIGILDTFRVDVDDYAHIIDLYMPTYGYCGYGMDLHIRKAGWFTDYIAYDRFTYPGSTIVIR